MNRYFRELPAASIFHDDYFHVVFGLVIHREKSPVIGRSALQLPQRLRAELDRWMRETGDPRATVDDDRWDRAEIGADRRDQSGDARPYCEWDYVRNPEEH